DGRGGSRGQAAPKRRYGLLSQASYKRLDRGKFIWPSAKEGVVSISAGQMAYMLEGIDWRNPQLTWRPKSAG
ncbi:MAG: IS66 family insertion sequence element accessory protein TnpB, partial [Pseudolabrys sp.]